jgi:hypothetical protein
MVLYKNGAAKQGQKTVNLIDDARTYRLQHGKAYAIVWSRRCNSWAVVEVP